MARNEAWVSVGRDHDTPAFAVASIRQWWTMMGRRAYPQAPALYITADAGGSNGYRSRAWKAGLQRLADDLGLAIHVPPHFPPGTSKWNKIEHRLFCHITQNWRGRPLRTFETVVALIGHTRTARGLRVKAKLDKRRYATVWSSRPPRCVTGPCIGTRFTETGTMNSVPGQVDYLILIRALRMIVRRSVLWEAMTPCVQASPRRVDYPTVGNIPLWLRQACFVVGVALLVLGVSSYDHRRGGGVFPAKPAAR